MIEKIKYEPHAHLEKRNAPKIIPLSVRYKRPPEQGVAPRNIVIHTQKFIEILNFQEVAFIKAEGNYCLFHLKNGTTVLSSKTLGSYKELLLQNGFIKPHSSFIVNTHYIRRIRKGKAMELELSTGSCIPVSRVHRKTVQNMFNPNML